VTNLPLSFDNPAGLWLLGALPVIVALWVLRPRRPRLRIPSVLLWPTSPAERRSATPWQRLRQHPLLWLQLLIAALLAFAAAQPFTPAEAADQRVVVLLDASGSMRAHDVSPSRWDAARAAVVDLAGSLSPDQSLGVVRLDAQPRVLIAEARDASAVRAALDGEAPGYGPIDAATSISLASGLARGTSSEWVLVGDGQFPELPPGVTMPAETHFRFISIGDPAAGNVALTGLSLRASDSALAAQLGIDNQSDLAASGTVALATDQGVVVASHEWSAGARHATYSTWDDIPTGASWFSARLTAVSPSTVNALATDDQAWAVAPRPDSTDARAAAQRALLVTSGNTFLERALAVDGNLRTFKVAPADWPALVSQGSAATYPLVVLDRQPRDAAPPPGSALYVGGWSGSSETFRPRLIAPAPDHPLLRNMDWSDVRVARAKRLLADELAGWQTVVDSDGGPLLLVRTVRDGEQVRREALLTFELGESDLPLRSAFPVLLANLLDWLAPRPAGSPRGLAPGATLQLEASPLASALRIESAMDGPSAGSPAAATGAEQLGPPWPPRPFRAPAPGVYRAVEDDPDGSVTTLVVADGYAASEANLTPAQPVALASQAGQSDAIGQALRSVRSGLWPWLLGGLLALGAAEWIVDSRGR
jgi:hypothetical protein